MAQTKALGIVYFLILLVLISTVSATDKTIAGKLGFTGRFEQLEVKVYVEVDSPITGKQICIINPTVYNGLDGSFATNLGNLFFKDFSTMRCNSFWRNGDSVWYEVSYENKTFSSNVEQIVRGTDAQLLGPLEIETPEEEQEEIVPPPSGGGGGGGSGGGAVALPPEQEEIPLEGGGQPAPRITATLVLDQKEEKVDATILLELLNNIESEITLKLVLFSFPNNFIVKTIEDNFYLEKTVEKEYVLDTGELEDGRYKLQTFVYVGEKLNAVSNEEDFFIKRKFYAGAPVEEKPEAKQVEQPSGIISTTTVLSGISFLIILLVILLLLWSWKKKEK